MSSRNSNILTSLIQGDSISTEEEKLWNLVNDYRSEHDLPAIPLSRALSIVANRHVLDLENNLGYLTHGWSDAPYDASNPDTYPSMWEAPQRFNTGYTGYGYENAFGASNGYIATAESAIEGWKGSDAHNKVILNQGIWSEYDWNAIGVGIYQGYAVLWFGQESDPTGEPILESVGQPTPSLNDGSNNTDDDTPRDDGEGEGEGNDISIITPSETNISSTTFTDQVIQLTNEFRAENNLPPLTLNVDLTEAAQGHSDDMAYQDFFDHTGLDGSQPGDRATAAGYDYTYLGENIQTGSTTPANVVQAWIDSPGHRANILTAEYEHIGVGYTYLENDPGDWTSNHYWTQVFGQSTDSYIPPDVDLIDDEANNSDNHYHLNGSQQNDRLLGSATHDLMLGGRGHDKIEGQDGDDILKGQHGNDKLKGGNGADTLLGGGGRDRLLGQNGDDLLKGGGGDDLLKGGAGNDRLYAQGKSKRGDILIGQQGADEYYLNPNAIAIIRTFDALDGDTIHLGGKISRIGLVEQGSDIELLDGNRLVAIVEKADINAVSDSLIF